MSNMSFNVGEIIWAKIRGYPWWPAIITGTEDDNREKKYAVLFIGDNTHSSLAKKYLDKFCCLFGELQNFGTFFIRNKSQLRQERNYFCNRNTFCCCRSF